MPSKHSRRPDRAGVSGLPPHVRPAVRPDLAQHHQGLPTRQRPACPRGPQRYKLGQGRPEGSLPQRRSAVRRLLLLLSSFPLDVFIHCPNWTMPPPEAYPAPCDIHCPVPMCIACRLLLAVQSDVMTDSTIIFFFFPSSHFPFFFFFFVFFFFPPGTRCSLSPAAYRTGAGGRSSTPNSCPWCTMTSTPFCFFSSLASTNAVFQCRRAWSSVNVYVV